MLVMLLLDSRIVKNYSLLDLWSSHCRAYSKGIQLYIINVVLKSKRF